MYLQLIFILAYLCLVVYLKKSLRHYCHFITSGWKDLKNGDSSLSAFPIYKSKGCLLTVRKNILMKAEIQCRELLQGKQQYGL